MEPRVPATEDGIQIVVEHASSSLQEEMCPFGRPLHVRSLDKAFADDLINGRLHKRRADRVPLTIAFAKVRNKVAIVANVRREFGEASRQFGNRCRTSAVDVEVERQDFQTLQRRIDVAVPPVYQNRLGHRDNDHMHCSWPIMARFVAAVSRGSKV